MMNVRPLTSHAPRLATAAAAVGRLAKEAPASARELDRLQHMGYAHDARRQPLSARPGHAWPSSRDRTAAARPAGRRLPVSLALYF